MNYCCLRKCAYVMDFSLAFYCQVLARAYLFREYCFNKLCISMFLASIQILLLDNKNGYRDRMMFPSFLGTLKIKRKAVASRC